MAFNFFKEDNTYPSQQLKLRKIWKWQLQKPRFSYEIVMYAEKIIRKAYREDFSLWCINDFYKRITCLRMKQLINARCATENQDLTPRGTCISWDEAGLWLPWSSEDQTQFQGKEKTSHAHSGLRGYSVHALLMDAGSTPSRGWKPGLREDNICQGTAHTTVVSWYGKNGVSKKLAKCPI